MTTEKYQITAENIQIPEEEREELEPAIRLLLEYYNLYSSTPDSILKVGVKYTPRLNIDLIPIEGEVSIELKCHIDDSRLLKEGPGLVHAIGRCNGYLAVSIAKADFISTNYRIYLRQ